MQRSLTKLEEIVEIESSDSEEEKDDTQEKKCTEEINENNDINKENTEVSNNLDVKEDRDIQKLMENLVNLCFRFQYSKEMNILLNKIIVPNFAKANKEYINSEAFYKLVQNVYSKMQTKDALCFTGLKRINMNLKANEARSKNNEVECIELDLSDIEEKAESDNEVITLDDEEVECKKPRLENNVAETRKRAQLMTLDKVEMGNVFVENEVQYMTVETDSRLIPLGEIDTMTYLSNPGDNVKKKSERDIRAAAIEQDLLNCLIEIQAYDQAEVDFDSEESVYIQGNRLKKKLIQLYEQLMELKGCRPEYKSQIVQLEIPKGQPKGPARRLEALINKKERINFPDFHDVVNCVATANIEDDLGWNSRQVLSESRSLFTQCGRQLQRRRQNLEWRHVQEMMVIGDDPADTDPVLKAKLDANWEIGRKKENDVIEMFTNADKLLQDKKGVSVTYDNKENKLKLGTENEDTETDPNALESNEDSDEGSFQFVKTDNQLLLLSREEANQSLGPEQPRDPDPDVSDVLDEDLFSKDVNQTVTILFDSSDEEDYDS